MKPGAPSSMSDLRVLHIDDDPFMLQLVKSTLDRLGIDQVNAATDGRAALQVLRDADLPPHVIICDLAMPGMDGFDTLTEIGARGFRGGVILLSGQSRAVLQSASLMGRYHHLHLLGVLHKPLQCVALGAALAQALELGTLS